MKGLKDRKSFVQQLPASEIRDTLGCLTTAKLLHSFRAVPAIGIKP